MHKVITTTYSEQELQAVIIDCVSTCLKHFTPAQQAQAQPDFIDIKGASQLLGISIAGIYGKVHDRTIPFFKREGMKKLFFSRKKLMEWLSEGEKKTRKEIKEEAGKILQNKNKK